MCPHLECIVNRLFVSMVLCVPIVSDMSIVFLSPLCQGYYFGVSYQSSICLHDVTSTQCDMSTDP